MRLAAPTDGHVLSDDGEGELRDITTLLDEVLKAFRRKAQLIFQDSYESPSPQRPDLESWPSR